jgi:acetyl esterase
VNASDAVKASERSDAVMAWARPYLGHVGHAESLPDVADGRAAFEHTTIELCGELEPSVETQDLHLPTHEGPIPVRVYRASRAVLPTLVYFHGGGFIQGSIQTSDAVCSRLARSGQFAVLSVGYRLAPENPFPAAVNDARSALRWLLAAGGSLGLDAERYAVAGESAGGNLAAGLALWCRAERLVPPAALQVLIYPWLDVALATTGSRASYGSGFGLDVAWLEQCARWYLRDMSEHNVPLVSPGAVKDLRDVAPAVILTAGCDPLCDEGETYGRRLADAGVAVTTLRAVGELHGFFRALNVCPTAPTLVDVVANLIAGRLSPSWRPEARAPSGGH